MNPSPDLAIWQFVVIAVIPTVLLAGWLISIFIADRDSAKPSLPPGSGQPRLPGAGDGQPRLPGAG